jgi:hypothetical protein
MKQSRTFLPLLLGVCCGVIGCQAGGKDASQSAQGENISVTIEAATVAGLPTCTAKLAGTVAYVTSTSTLYSCSSNQWRAIACNTSNAGDVAYASKSQTLLACVAKKWTPISVPEGADSLIAQTPEPAGSHCENGGVRIDTGVDKNDDDVLDSEEIQQTSYVCNGTSGSAGVGGGSGGTSGGGGMGGSSDDSPCLTAGRDLVLIGDSYVNYIESIEPKLTQRAREDGALSAADRFDDHAVAGASLAANSPLIPPQWSEAKGANPGIKYVVMDGGGMDVLLWNTQCLADGVGNANDAGCQKVMTDALAVADMLVTDMKSSGVREVVYFFYPHMPAGGSDILDWSFPMFKNMCEGKSDSAFHCNMLDTRPIFEGHPEYFMLDSIHPLAEGSQAIADAIWKTLTNQCITLPASGGCCMP